MTSISTPVNASGSGDSGTPTHIDDTPVVVLRRSWKATIFLGVFAVLMFILLVPFARDGKATFGFSDATRDAVQLPQLVMSGRAAELTVAIVLLVLAALAVVIVRVRLRVPLWYLVVFAFVLIAGFLIWNESGTGRTLNVTDLLVGAFGLSAPLIFGGLGGVISERVGVTNVAIEAQLLFGAFLSAIAASITGNVYVGIIAAMAAGVLVSLVLGAFSIKYAVNQVIVGIVLNVLILGLTTFLYEQVLVPNASSLNNPPQLKVLDIPLLYDIPVIGPVLFSQTIIVYLMYVAVIVTSIALYRTRWGLRVRAVGEHPQAADTVGINVGRTRLLTVMIAGAVAGLGGAYYTVGSVGSFSQDMTSGAGFIALAAVILGRWDPVRVTLAALLFGFAQNLGYVLGSINSPVPNDFLLMFPYIVTIFAVAGVIGRVRGPAAAGRPYIKS